MRTKNMLKGEGKKNEQISLMAYLCVPVIFKDIPIVLTPNYTRSATTRGLSSFIILYIIYTNIYKDYIHTFDYVI